MALHWVERRVEHWVEPRAAQRAFHWAERLAAVKAALKAVLRAEPMVFR